MLPPASSLHEEDSFVLTFSINPINSGIVTINGANTNLPINSRQRDRLILDRAVAGSSSGMMELNQKRGRASASVIDVSLALNYGCCWLQAEVLQVWVSDASEG